MTYSGPIRLNSLHLQLYNRQDTVRMLPFDKIDRQKIVTLTVALILFALDMEGDSSRLSAPSKPTHEQASGVPPEIHGAVGDSSAGWKGKLRMINIGKRQQHDWKDKATLDTDIFSPKSVNFHPDGKRCYVNSLEGCRTVVYTVPELEKVAVIEHRFPSSTGNLWAPSSDYYSFTHYPGAASRPFQGKPVEGAFSHSGRYFWVPYYRRSFDINAQDPSAVAVIDTKGDSIVRMFETGPLPKMVAYSADAGLIAITHWGDNTVGLIDVRSATPNAWHHIPPLIAGKKQVLDFPLDKSIDRDAKSGLKLRGTVFTPGGRYLLVSAMGGPMQVFDILRHEYVGHINSAYGVRHLIIKDDILYGSQNIAATVLSLPLDSLIPGINKAIETGNKTIAVNGWKKCKVGGGARTLDASPDGKLLFVACNSASEVCAVDAESMTVVDRIKVDSYPVGLDVSEDGGLMAVTSQGRKGFGGNALNLFRIERPGYIPTASVVTEEKDNLMVVETKTDETNDADEGNTITFNTTMILIVVTVFLIMFILLGVIMWERHKRQGKNNNRNI